MYFVDMNGFTPAVSEVAGWTGRCLLSIYFFFIIIVFRFPFFLVLLIFVYFFSFLVYCLLCFVFINFLVADCTEQCRSNFFLISSFHYHSLSFSFFLGYLNSFSFPFPFLH